MAASLGQDCWIGAGMRKASWTWTTAPESGCLGRSGLAVVVVVVEKVPYKKGTEEWGFFILNIKLVTIGNNG